MEGLWISGGPISMVMKGNLLQYSITVGSLKNVQCPENRLFCHLVQCIIVTLFEYDIYNMEQLRHVIYFFSFEYQ